MWQQLIDILFPPVCINCKRPGSALCGVCKNTITFAGAPEDPNLIAIFEYGNPLVRDILWQCKYHHRTGAFEILTKAAVPFIMEAIAEKSMSEKIIALTLVPIPQHHARTSRRGYSQSLLAAKILARAIPKARVENILTKIKNTIPQAQVKNRNDRLRNVNFSMHYRKRADPKKIYLIIDDVTTTGATLQEGIRALHDAGAVHILGVAIAHGYRNKTDHN